MIDAPSVRDDTKKEVGRWFRKVLAEIDFKNESPNAPVVFSNEQFGDLRVMEIDGEPWFIGSELARKLAYTNPQKAVRDHVDEEDKRTEQIVHPSGGVQSTILINESGMYSLVLSSKLPSAKEFKHWVTSDVLPSIRKNGIYKVNNQATAIQLIMQRFDKLETKLLEDKPKVDFYNAMQAAEGSVRMDCLANILAKKGVQSNGKPIGRNRLYERLREEGWLSKNRIVDGYGKKIYENRPTQKAIERGLFERIASHNHGVLSYTVYVTAKGITFFTEVV